jgi:predicted MFS family arabinose efflux permease
MFESRIQVAQVFEALAFVLEMIGIPTTLYGPAAVGVFCIVLAHASAAIGCYIHAEAKGYPPLIGIPIGVIFGMGGAIAMSILPDDTRPDTLALDRRFAEEGIENARRRDKGYEVLDDED